jgi:hypothetical protein
MMLVLSACSGVQTGEPSITVDTGNNRVERTNDEARVIVTRNFGQELLLDTSLILSKNINAMDALKNVAQVETAYGGGFVNDINGISSKYKGINSEPVDWFFYVNGIMANYGCIGL